MEAEGYVPDVAVGDRETSAFALASGDAKPVLGVLTQKTLELKGNSASGKLAARPPASPTIIGAKSISPLR